MMFYYFAACLAAITFLSFSSISHAEYIDPAKAQFHVQTDEGSERYFKYQTLSGQYRKEKRLEDGTVIGSYGWVDDDGYFRMRDYVADNAGYRILKTKNVFVGRNRPVSEALSIARKAPAEPSFNSVQTQSTTKYTTPSPQSSVPYTSPPRTYVVPVGFSTAQHQTPVFKYATYTYPQTGHTPSVEVLPNSVPSSTIEPPIDYSTAIPSSTFLPPDPPTPTSTPSISTTSAPVYIQSTTPLPSTGSTPSYQSTTTNYKQDTSNYAHSTLPQIPSNALDPLLYSSEPQYEHYPNENKESLINPYIFQNGPTYPIDRRGHTYNGQSNSLGNGYDPQFSLYNGISVTNDGFRYYIPKQYHEEQQLPDNTKSGSFGYVDPFGIRRVIYYNAGPDGFKHRKNNRYVGLNATPYDPRPY